MNIIQKSSIIHTNSKIGENVSVGHFSVVGPNVKIGKNCIIHSHVVIDGDTTIGSGNIIYPFSVIGSKPQHLKYDGEKSKLIIGDNNIIREHVTMHPGTEIGIKKTVVGNNGFFMVGSHVAHDCIVGNNVVFVNNAVIGGHVEISDFVYLGGHTAVHQFCRIGKHAIIGAGTTIDGDVIPFTSVVGSRGTLSGLNLVGLKRRSFSKEQIKTLRNAYRLLFAPEGTFVERLSEVKDLYRGNDLINEILLFLEHDSNRSLVQPRMDRF
ncbi:acyl-ACP--UDP-N-acetylglucosamine O-acyltransferase [Alphaproteobacteria bacterium]|nr:acyl-ACP--UDP-N-acetylglucosamine O-acyltransferase [Alphaproteobacteria bacterium]